MVSRCLTHGNQLEPPERKAGTVGLERGAWEARETRGPCSAVRAAADRRLRDPQRPHAPSSWHGAPSPWR